MEHSAKAYLFDIQRGCEDIKEFVQGIDCNSYCCNKLLKAAVERKFLVIGEAAVRLRKEYPQIVQKISDHAKIIGFRNILVHGYDMVDDRTVWSAIQDNIPLLQQEVSRLLSDDT